MKPKTIQRTASRTRHLCLLVACLLGIAPQGFAAGVDVVLDRLENPWAIAFLGDGRMLVSEKRGRLRILDSNGRLGKPLGGLPRVGQIHGGKVDVPGQGGLLDVITDRNFSTNRTLYFCFSEEKNGKVSTAMSRARLAADETRLENVQVIFSQAPKVDSWMHFGCRIAQGPDSHLFLAMGDMQVNREHVQDLDTHIGKVVRVTTEGKVPSDNPFVGKAKARPENWSVGHKNIQASAVSPAGELWVAEHGAWGGDELNRVLPGKNYGWPLVSHGKEYDGRPVGMGQTHQDGLEPPVRSLTDPPSGMAFLKSDRFGARWPGSILISYLRGGVRRLEMVGNRITREVAVWESGDERVRDVREAPDGQIYLLTDHPTNGRLLKLRP